MRNKVLKDIVVRITLTKSILHLPSSLSFALVRAQIGNSVLLVELKLDCRFWKEPWVSGPGDLADMREAPPRTGAPRER